MPLSLGRRATVEAVGTGLLVAVIVGSGIAAQRLAPDQPGLVLVANSAATAGGLMALILAFAPISGAHLNPIVTLANRLLGHLGTRATLAYIAAQLSGGIAGVIVANTMFELPVATLSSVDRSSPGLWLGEVVATFGLLTVILTIAAGRTSVIAFAVAGYIGAGYWFTSSTSFTNPAVTIARTLSDTFTGIDPKSAPAFVAAQLAGGLIAVALARYLTATGRGRPVAALEQPDAARRPDMATLEDLTPEQRHALRSAAEALHREFDGTFGTETIEQFLATSYEQFAANSRIVNWLPMMAERFARQRLHALAKVEGHATSGLPTVLFLCVHNAGRSQMALGWFNHLAGGRAVAWSGGSEPGDEINQTAVKAMAEVGIDITSEFPKPWTDEIVRAADVVITMGCGDACPLFPGKRYEDWQLTDPADADPDTVRSIRDDIRDRVRTLLTTLGIEPS